MSAEWYYQLDGAQVGPMTAADLKRHAQAGRITPDTLIRRGEQAAWHPASKVRGLLASAQPSPQSTVPPSSGKQAASMATPVNLVLCPDCGHKVSVRAKACPSCGGILADDDRIERRSRSASSGGVNFATAHDLDDDGSADMFVMHNTQQLGQAIDDFREAVGIPDDETQYRFLKKWGWYLTGLSFVILFLIGYGLPDNDDQKIMFGLMLGGIGSAGFLFFTFIAQFVDD